MTIRTPRPTRRTPLLVATLAAALAGCGGSGTAQRAEALYAGGDYAGAAALADRELPRSPGDDDLWRVRVRAALAQADAPAIATTYAGYAAARGEDGDDAELLADLATVTIAQALESRSIDVRVAAIEVVEDVMLMALADTVADQMAHDDDRVAAAAAVAILRGYPQAPHIATDLMASDDADARRIATAGIGRKVADLAAADLQRMARDPDAAVRAAAITALAPLDDAPSRGVVAAALADEDEAVRAVAAAALARDRARTPAELLAFARTADADANVGVRVAAVALFEAAGERTELTRLAADDDLVVAVRAAVALDEPGDPVVSAAIDRALAATEPSIRAGAVNALVAALGREAGVARARTLLADDALLVRLAAARAVAHAGDRDAAVPVFVAALASAQGVQAAADLAALGDARGVEALTRRLLDRASTADARAATARAHRTARRVSPGLVAALADPSGMVRVVAAGAILQLSR